MDVAVDGVSKAAEDAKQDNRDKLIYPLQQLSNGIMSSFFSTYLNSMMTMIYVFPLAVAGFVESVSQALGWVIGPISGAIMDRISFKKAKFWPWIIIGSIGMAICWVLIYSIPSLVSNPQAWAVPVAAIIILQRVLAGPNTAVGNTLYAQIAKNSKLRAYIAMWGKITRDGAKVITGFLFPLMLTGFLATGMTEVKAWSYIAIILAGSSMIGYAIVVGLVKGSRPEKEAMAGLAAGRRKSAPISRTITAIFTNRALLGAFLSQTLSKVFFFYHIMGAMFLCRYYFLNVGILAVYMTTLNLASVGGAMLVPLVYKVLKDTRLCATMTYVFQIVLYGIAYFVLSPTNPWPGIILICAAFFFNGMSDSFLQPLFAHGADYSVWKSGNKDYGLNMAVFALSVTTGSLLSTITRTSFLAGGGFVSADLTPAKMAAGAVVPQGVAQAIHNMNTLYPLIISAMIILVLVFIYNLTDKKVEELQKQIAERDAAAAKA